jgi:hypothetical protein
MAPEAIQALQDEVTRLMMRADISLRDQITSLENMAPERRKTSRLCGIRSRR